MRIDPHFFPPIVVQSLDKEKRKGEGLNIFRKRGHEILQSYRTEADASPHKYAGERCVGEEIYRSKEFRIIH